MLHKIINYAEDKDCVPRTIVGSIKLDKRDHCS